MQKAIKQNGNPDKPDTLTFSPEKQVVMKLAWLGRTKYAAPITPDSETVETTTRARAWGRGQAERSLEEVTINPGEGRIK